MNHKLSSLLFVFLLCLVLVPCSLAGDKGARIDALLAGRKFSGKLDYGDDVRKFIPGLPYAGISVRHLLHHTSGLPDYKV